MSALADRRRASSRRGSDLPSVLGELTKLAAFVRRDIRIAMSYRMAAVTSVLGIAVQVLVLSWIGKIVTPGRLPVYGGVHISYMAFVTIGLSVNMVATILLYQVSSAIRQEQMVGTLESLLCTPTAVWTLQLGSAAASLLGVPLRLSVFLTVLAIVFGLDFHANGILPSALIILFFIPSLWGIGLAMAGAIVTFRRGGGALSIGAAALGLSSGAFFPLSVLPSWLHAVADGNPLTIAVNTLRQALLGGTGWAGIGTHLVELAPLSIGAMVFGAMAFRLALRRERRHGTLGLY